MCSRNRIPCPCRMSRGCAVCYVRAMRLNQHRSCNHHKPFRHSGQGSLHLRLSRTLRTGRCHQLLTFYGGLFFLRDFFNKAGFGFKVTFAVADNVAKI